MQSSDRHRWFVFSIQFLAAVLVLLLCSIFIPRQSRQAPGAQGIAESTTPVFFRHSHPKDYNQETFALALRQNLTPEEASLVVNPLVCTTEMEKWVRDLTDGATNDLLKARMLFDALTNHFSTKPAQFAQPP